VTAAPKLSVDGLLAAALVAVIVPGLGAWIGAHTGTRGTVVGTAIGAVLSVLCGWLVLRVTYHAKAGLVKVPWRKAKPWQYAVAVPVVAVAVFVVAMGVLSGAEAGVFHRSLSAEVSGSRAGGTTFGTVVGVHAPATDPVRPSTAGHKTAQGHPSASATASPAPPGSPSFYPEPNPTAGSAAPAAPATAPEPSATQPATTGDTP